MDGARTTRHRGRLKTKSVDGARTTRLRGSHRPMVREQNTSGPLVPEGALDCKCADASRFTGRFWTYGRVRRGVLHIPHAFFPPPCSQPPSGHSPLSPATTDSPQQPQLSPAATTASHPAAATGPYTVASKPVDASLLPGTAGRVARGSAMSARPGWIFGCR